MGTAVSAARPPPPGRPRADAADDRSLSPFVLQHVYFSMCRSGTIAWILPARTARAGPPLQRRLPLRPLTMRSAGLPGRTAAALPGMKFATEDPNASRVSRNETA